MQKAGQVYVEFISIINVQYENYKRSIHYSDLCLSVLKNNTFKEKHKGQFDLFFKSVLMRTTRYLLRYIHKIIVKFYQLLVILMFNMNQYNFRFL